MMKRYLLLFSISLFNLVVQAQVSNMDSLLQQLKTVKEDTTGINLYLQIGDAYEGVEPLRAKEYYRKAIELSTKMKLQAATLKSIFSYTSVFGITGEYDSSMLYCKKALMLAREIKDSLSTGIALLNIGVAHGFLENYDSAIQNFQEGLKMTEGKAYKKLEVQINDRLQVLYWKMAQYDKAIGFGEKAVRLARQWNMPFQLAQSLSNLSLSFLSKSMQPKALPLLTEALGIAKSIGSNNLESAILVNLSDILMVNGDYEKAKQYIDRSLSLHRGVGSQDGEAVSLRALAMYYMQKKDFDNAKKMASASAIIAKKNGLTLDHAEAIHVLSSVAFATGDMKLGDQYYREYGDSIKSLVKKLVSQKSADLEKKYETEKKETQIKKLEAEKQVQQLSIRQKNTLNYILIGSALTLLIISLLSYGTYQQKQKLQQQRISELETEKQLTATEGVLKGEEQERSRLAKDLHDGLGGMLSGIKYSLNTMKGNLVMTPGNAQAFERSMDMLDSSIQEMRRVAHNMMPEALAKFGLDTALKDFCNDVNQTGVINVAYSSIGLENEVIAQTTSITIYRIVQELINNTMKHAAATAAIVQLSKTGSQLSLTVEDDGKGFDPAILERAKGIGWTNIQSRVAFLKGKLDVKSEAGKGTSVYIEINT